MLIVFVQGRDSSRFSCFLSFAGIIIRKGNVDEFCSCLEVEEAEFVSIGCCLIHTYTSLSGPARFSLCSCNAATSNLAKLGRRETMYFASNKSNPQHCLHSAQEQSWHLVSLLFLCKLFMLPRNIMHRDIKPANLLLASVETWDLMLEFDDSIQEAMWNISHWKPKSNSSHPFTSPFTTSGWPAEATHHLHGSGCMPFFCFMLESHTYLPQYRNSLAFGLTHLIHHCEMAK